MASTKHLPLEHPEVRRRFESKYRVTERVPKGLDTACWLWQRPTDKDGYGEIKWNGVNYKSHRFSYMLNVGPIDPGMDIDHRCEVRKCVNPDHLEMVTHHENIRRVRTRKVDPDEGSPDDEPVEPEVVLETIREMLEGHPFEGALGVVTAQDEPWREYAATETEFDPDNKWMRAALFLFAVECGVRPRVAARVIFNCTPYAMHSWSQNDEWQKDLAAARNKAISRRWGDYRDNWFDAAERKMRTMSADDLAKHGRILVQHDAVEAEKNKPAKGLPALASGGNNFYLVIENPAKFLDNSIEGTARVVDDRPRLPAPDDDDDD